MVAALGTSMLTATLAAQTAGARRQQVEPGGGDLSPAEIQRLFDAYAVVQAQEMLKLADVQYGQFVTRLKVLQQTRRRNQQQRQLIVQDLLRLSNQTPPADDAVLRERIKALDEQETRALADLRKAYEGIDQLLDVRQQARFRVFEDQMERRKFELLLRARQANRLNRPRVPPP
jgi:hypothetical protein